MIKMDHKTQTEKFNRLIRQLFDSEEWEKRAEAAQEIGQMGVSHAANLLIKVLNKEKDAVVINRLIEALGHVGDPKATQSIIEFLNKELAKPEEEQDKRRLFFIIEALMKLGDKRALKHLGILLNSCEADIKQLTEEAFECIDPNWKENIKKSDE